MTNKQTLIVEGIVILSMIAIVCMDVFIITPNLMKNNSFIEVEIQLDKSGYPYLAEKNGEVFIILNADFGLPLNTDRYGKRLYYSECLPDSLKKTDKKILISNR